MGKGRDGWHLRNILDGEGTCTPDLGLIGLIGDSYQQVATSFSEAHLERTLKLSVLGLEKFRDGYFPGARE